jgi:hypothetical protein
MVPGPVAGARKGTGMMNEIAKLRLISPKELALLGVEDVAYVKRVMANGAAAYAIHAADGTEMAVLADRDLAFATLRQHDLEPLSVH